MARLFLLLLVLGIGPAAAAAPAAAPPPAHQTLTYAVYAGGLDVVAATLVLDDSGKDRYHITLSAWTRGFLGTLVPWKGTFETEGWRLKKGARTPEIYRSSSVWHKKEEIKEFTYAKDGSF